MDRPAVVASAPHLAIADNIAGIADTLEVRLDLGATTVDDIRAYEGPVPLVVTDRVGDVPSDRAVARLDAIGDVLDHPWVWAIDLDRWLFGDDCELSTAAAAARLVETARSADVSVICSAHPSGTPNQEAMAACLEETGAIGDIAKLAVHIESPSPLGDLVGATAAAIEAEDHVATMATGPYGLPSRVMAVALGCDLVYGTPPGVAPVAAGQPAIATLRSVVDALS